jgi:hypothetical protein
VATEGRGRKLEEWRVRADRSDNHWWDCLVGCAVAASVAGLQWSAGTAAGEEPRAKVGGPRKKVKWSEKYKDKFAAWGN